MTGFFRPDLPPDTIYHIGVSGGKDSTAVLLWMLHESGVPREFLNVTFCDTGNEDKRTLDHVELLSRTVFPIQTLHPKMGFFDLALHKRRFPSAKVRFCTQLLKIKPTQDHVQALRDMGRKVVAVSGVRAIESVDRAQLGEWDYSGELLSMQWRPIIHWSLEDVLAIHKKHGVPLNPLYAMGAQRVGCFPCVMSRKEEVRLIALQAPERIDFIRSWEQKIEATHGRYSSFFPNDKVPPRFCSMPYTGPDGRDHMVATIDDVVRWSLTGHRAKGSWMDEAPEDKRISCTSGFCE